MRCLLAFVAAFAMVIPGAASAANQAKPMRTLVYAIVYSAENRNNEQTSGFSGGGGGAGTAGGMVTRVSQSGDDGTLTVNVIAAPPDGGLVVDCTFAGKSTQQTALRVAIFSDGRLSMPPDAVLSPAASYMLPLLARGLVADRSIEPGATWSRPMAAPAKGTTTFRVTGVNGDNATLKIDGSVSVPGARGYDETDDGTAVYDTAKLAPVSYDLTAMSRHVMAEQYITSNVRLTAKLVSDSFGAK
jgi:hypothetical protein